MKFKTGLFSRWRLFTGRGQDQICEHLRDALSCSTETIHTYIKSVHGWGFIETLSKSQK